MDRAWDLLCPLSSVVVNVAVVPGAPDKSENGGEQEETSSTMTSPYPYPV